MACGTSSCCTRVQLCDRCYGRELITKRPQARVVGECWAERVCRGARRAQQAWPEHDEKTITIARRLVSALAHDPRLRDELAAACARGAAAWWQRRPPRYRS
jgi:hypothetical protein